MEQKKEWTAGFGGRLATGALLFVLLAEWLRPLAAMHEMTGITRVEPLILTLAGLIGVDVLRFPAVPGWLFKTVLILSLPAVYHDGASLLDGAWWSGFLQTLAEDAGVIGRMEWMLISPELRTLLFVYAWAIVAACLFAAVYFKRFALWFTGATLVYLLTVDWWIGWPAFWAALRVAFAGLVLHLLYVPSVLQRQQGFARLAVHHPARWTTASLSLALLLLGSAAAAAGWAAPRMEESAAVRALSAMQWPFREAFPAIRPATASPAKSGYGEDDERLGEPLDMNHEPAFLAVSLRGDRYWRGEAKLVYTGKGWVGEERAALRLTLGEWRHGLDERSRDGTPGSPVQVPAGAESRRPYGERTEPAREEWHLVHWLDGSLARRDRWPLFVTGEPSEIAVPGYTGSPAAGIVDEGVPSKSAHPDRMGDEAPLLELDGRTGNVHLARPAPSAAGFFVRYAGRAGGAEGAFGPENGPSGGPLADREPYLQLPDTLPDRVRELAVRITEPHDAPIDKALAIERYLKEHYAYSLKPAVPGEDGDFADHFLFVARAGYCDHFSTAMTVLLRAADVPARWVKGFVPGDPMAEDQALQLLEEAGMGEWVSAAAGQAGGSPAYTLVRNSDAHSWVEAYIPGTGWVAFEPTPGFAGDEGGIREPAREALAPVEGSRESRTARVRRYWERLTDGSAGLVAGLPRGGPAVLYTAGCGAAVAVLAVLAIRFMRRGNRKGTPERPGRLRIGFRLLLYRIGFAKWIDDARLVEDMLACRLGPCRSDCGVTMREAARRAAGNAGAANAGGGKPVAGNAPCGHAGAGHAEAGKEAHEVPVPDDGTAPGRDPVRTAAADPLWKAVRLYERVRYGPPRKDRLPAGELARLWRAMVRGGHRPGP